MCEDRLTIRREKMGTRHSIEVKIDGELKIAQYGQWDGYPSGQGKFIADFIQDKMDTESFKTALRECSFMTDKEISDFNSEERKVSWTKTHPWLSRDAGAKILSYVQDDGIRKLVGDTEFKNDSVFCEYHYLIDMDNELVTINNHKPIPFKEFTPEKMDEIEKTENEEDED